MAISAVPTDRRQQRTRRQMLHGVVVARSGVKTVAVAVTRVMQHAKYRKRVVRTKKYLVHDASGAVRIGQAVTIRASRPLSARKRWIVMAAREGVPDALTS